MQREQPKYPAYQWYPGDAATDEAYQLLSYEQVGIFKHLLDHQWINESLPSDTETILRLCPKITPSRFRKVWPAIKNCFRLRDDGRLVNDRLERQRRELHDYVADGRRGGVNSARARRAKFGTAQPPRPEPITPNPPSADSRTPLGRGGFEGSPNSSSSSSSSRREREDASLSPAAPPLSDPRHDPFTDPAITMRAGHFVERYQALYSVHRHGARYAVRPVRDYAAAVTLCQTWADDARLEKLAIIFLTSDHKFAVEGSRTIPQFLALASWCDGRLAEHEARQTA